MKKAQTLLIASTLSIAPALQAQNMIRENVNLPNHSFKG